MPDTATAAKARPDDDRMRTVFAGLTDDEREAILAALAAMVLDSHAAQDQLTPEQWRAAERMFRWLNGPPVSP